ncbi:DUF3284 domain-containing protein [Marinilactibacillus psychrotolerans]|uniref:DUF3284 domain-containing protein n=1 Tax=Marinilactibacillus psychrotolerans TaxID=191770 RepID=A0A5R9C4H7_9LACT|nr:DUF3284 domain-containing protein [Marinilactibacillus psychrotolerans]TLQ07781.1 DUF3284 domain-containing protein [Marinilactibacillus psychrotolerans]
MEIYRELNISAEQLFATITRSVLYDLNCKIKLDD